MLAKVGDAQPVSLRPLSTVFTCAEMFELRPCIGIPEQSLMVQD